MEMAIRFYASMASSARFPRDKACLTPIVYNEMDDALGAARNGLARGLNVLAIECDDGRTLLPSDIQKLARERGHELVGRPRVY
jgi:hypothetical protein